MPVAILIYETSSGYTEKMAKAIESVLQETGVQVILRRTMGMKVDELTDVDAVILGSPTYNHDLIFPMKTFLNKMEEVDLKGKFGAAFGSYGYTGEAVQIMTDSMRDTFGMQVLEPGLKLLSGWDEVCLERCREFGEKIGERMISRGAG